MQILLLADLVDIDWILFSHKLWSQNKPYLERNWAHSSCGQIYLHSTAVPRFVFALRGLPRICASQSAAIQMRCGQGLTHLLLAHHQVAHRTDTLQFMLDILAVQVKRERFRFTRE